MGASSRGRRDICRCCWGLESGDLGLYRHCRLSGVVLWRFVFLQYFGGLFYQVRRIVSEAGV